MCVCVCVCVYVCIPCVHIKCQFRPTSFRRRRYCIEMITQRVQCECSDSFTCVLKLARCGLPRQNDADSLSQNAPY